MLLSIFIDIFIVYIMLIELDQFKNIFIAALRAKIVRLTMSYKSFCSSVISDDVTTTTTTTTSNMSHNSDYNKLMTIPIYIYIYKDISESKIKTATKSPACILLHRCTCVYACVCMCACACSYNAHTSVMYFSGQGWLVTD